MAQETRQSPKTRRADAVRLVADDRLTDETIAHQLGIGRRTLERWKTEPDFHAEVRAIRVAAQEAALSEAIAVKANRLHDYQELRRRLWGTILARAESGQKVQDGDEYGRKPAPGVEQGLMVRKITPTRTGFIEEWAVDTAVIAELRNLDKQAAQEMGDWTDKVAQTDPTGQKEHLSDAYDTLSRRLARLSAALSTGGMDSEPDAGGG